VTENNSSYKSSPRYPGTRFSSGKVRQGCPCSCRWW